MQPKNNRGKTKCYCLSYKPSGITLSSMAETQTGRPSIYSDELALEICERIALGESLRAICSDEAMPALRTVMYWRNSNPDFLQQYTRAKEDQAETYEEMMLETAKTEEDVQRARLIVDTMKWTAAKLKPKKYGDKLDLTSGGDKINRSTPIEEIDAILARAAAEDSRTDKPALPASIAPVEVPSRTEDQYVHPEQALTPEPAANPFSAPSEVSAPGGA